MKLSEHTIWYKKPAENADESLPLGNGRITASVAGGINDDIISVNDYSATFDWQSRQKGFGELDAVNRVRELICDGNISEAEFLLKSKVGMQSYKFVPMTKIRIHSDFISRISKYRRELRLDRGVHKLTFCAEGKNYTRESFISSFAQVFAMRISCDRLKSINFVLSVESSEDAKVFMLGNTLCISSSVSENSNYSAEPDGKAAETPFLGALSLRTVGGNVIYSENKIKVIDADEATIYFSIRTKAFEFEKNYNINYNDYNKQCFADIHYAQKLPYFDLINQSIAEHKNIYEKCCISLEDEKCGRVSTDIRIKRHLEGQRDYALYPLMYNTGKYLSITCSQYQTDLNQIVGDEYCPNSSKKGAKKIKFWPLYPCGLFESYDAFLSVVQRICEEGKRDDGWVYDYLGDELSQLKLKYGKKEEINFWKMSSAWMSLILWKYYLYNNDRDYLERIYPIMYGAASFLKNRLVKKDGMYILPPSALCNPEDKISEDTDDYSPIVQDGLYYLFAAVSKAMNVMSVDNEYAELFPLIKRCEFFAKGNKCKHAEDILLDEYTIHIIHFTGFHNLDKSDYIKERLRKRMYSRSEPDGNDSTIGWQVCIGASLHEGEKALELLDKQLALASKKSGITNIVGYYSRFIGINPTFGMYSNMTICSGILNMLIQFDEEGTPILLPAVPKEWTRGKVNDLKIPGNRKINFSWNEGKIVDYKIEEVNKA